MRPFCFPITFFLAFAHSHWCYGQHADLNRLEERNEIQLSYSRIEFFEANRTFEPFQRKNIMAIGGASLAYWRRMKAGGKAHLGLEQGFFVGGYQIPEPFLPGQPAQKLMSLTSLLYARDLIALPSTTFRVNTGGRFRYGYESFYTYQWFWETNMAENELMDAGLVAGMEMEQWLFRRVNLSLECSYTRYVYRKALGFPYDFPRRYNTGGTKNTLDIRFAIGFRFGSGGGQNRFKTDP